VPKASKFGNWHSNRKNEKTEHVGLFPKRKKENRTFGEIRVTAEHRWPKYQVPVRKRKSGYQVPDAGS
jgi:hypothetical protein